MIDAITSELSHRKNEIKEDIKSIYLGGGTPSILKAIDIEKMLNTIYKNYNVSPNPEITIEANPDDISRQKLIDIKQTPINRFSIGIQSFHKKDLLFMNRAHDDRQANECIPMLQDAGYTNITVDLIYGLPKQSNEEWMSNLQKLFSNNIPHISAYSLTVEKNTPLNSLINKGKYPQLSDEKAWEDYQLLVEKTKNAGFIQYELSNFGKQGYFSKHNSSYWKGEKYLGIGPSAHSFDGEIRRWNVASNKLYIEKSHNHNYFEFERLSSKDKFNEYLMTGLRTIWGVSTSKISVDFSEFTHSFFSKIKKLEQEGKIIIHNEYIFISDKMKFQTDGIISHLFEV